jgi:O-antigen ligase
LSLPFLNRATAAEVPAASRSAADPRAAARTQAWLAGVFIFLAVMTPLWGWLGVRGYAPGVGFAGLLCLGLARPRSVDWVGLILFALLVEWAVISAFWSPEPLPHTAHDIGRFTGLHLAQQIPLSGALMIAARRMQPSTASRALAALAIGLGVLIVVLLAEWATGAALFQGVQPIVGKRVRPDLAMRSVNQGGYVLALLVWPTAAALWLQRRRWAVALIGLGTAATLALLHVSAPLFAVVAGGAVFALVLWAGRPVVRGLTGFVIAETVLTPWLMRGFVQGGLLEPLRGRLPPSWAARTDIWTFTSARMVEKPLFGWGLDASRTFKDHIPLHPHDGPLQLWFELGVPGAILGALAWTFVFWRLAELARRDRLAAAAGCAVATACLWIGAFSFSLWQEWWICLSAFAFAAVVALAAMRSQPEIARG